MNKIDNIHIMKYNSCLNKQNEKNNVLKVLKSLIRIKVYFRLKEFAVSSYHIFLLQKFTLTKFGFSNLLHKAFFMSIIINTL